MLAGLDQARMSIFVVHVAVWFLVNKVQSETRRHERFVRELIWGIWGHYSWNSETQDNCC